MSEQILSYEDFKTKLLDELRSFFPENYQVKIESILKSNSIFLDALMIASPTCHIIPNIYLNYFYDRYQKGISYAQTREDILSCYRQRKTDPPFDLRQFSDFSYVRQHLTLRLISQEKNEELLASLPHIPFLDLAIVFYLLLEDAEHQYASILIRNVHLASWGDPSPQDLLAIARENTPQLLPYTFCPIEEMLDLYAQSLSQKQATIPSSEELPNQENFHASQIYVLCNQARLFASATLLYPGLLDTLSDRFASDLIVIPSSVHEILILPYSKNYGQDFLDQMIQQVNQEQVPAPEVLSDHAYFYDRKRRELQLQLPLAG